MYNSIDLMQDFTHKEVFIVHQKNPSYDSEVHILDEIGVLKDFLDSVDPEEIEVPIVTHGMIIPVGYIDEDMLKVANIGIMTVNDVTTPESDEMNSLFGNSGLCIIGKVVNVINDEVRKKKNVNLLDKLTEEIEKLVREENLENGEFYFVIGNEVRVRLDIDNDDVDDEVIGMIDEMIDELSYKEKEVKYNQLT